MSIFKLPGAEQVDRRIVGGKASSVHRMQSLGVAVPPAFVIGTNVCAQYFQAGHQLPDDLVAALPDAMRWLEQASGKTFGGGDRPLLVSVRSGGAISMPGMMDTVLNLGINDTVETALGTLTDAPAFAADTRERFVEQYEKIVGVKPSDEPWQQLLGAIAAVFESWQSPRAIAYRRDRGYAQDAGTAVTVQAMVFGNLDAASGTGVLFTRDPNSGAPQPYGEWLHRGQGEEVVSGRRTPESLDQLAQQLPDAHRELLSSAALLEREMGDVQDIEFTIEAGKLWLLQTRSAKRSPQAAVRLAVALHEEGLITRAQALDRLTVDQVQSVLQPQIDALARPRAAALANGRLASPGVAAGIIVTDVDEAERRALAGESILLARPTTDPDDVHAMSVVAGVLTELGGATSHAAVVSRELGVPCIVGCGADSLTPHNGRAATMDATTGEVLDGVLPIHLPAAKNNADLLTLLEWARSEGPGMDAEPLTAILLNRSRR